jgi:hypothetical protein
MPKTESENLCVWVRIDAPPKTEPIKRFENPSDVESYYKTKAKKGDEIKFNMKNKSKYRRIIETVQNFNTFPSDGIYFGLFIICNKNENIKNDTITKKAKNDQCYFQKLKDEQSTKNVLQFIRLKKGSFQTDTTNNNNNYNTKNNNNNYNTMNNNNNNNTVNNNNTMNNKNSHNLNKRIKSNMSSTSQKLMKTSVSNDISHENINKNEDGLNNEEFINNSSTPMNPIIPSNEIDILNTPMDVFCSIDLFVHLNKENPSQSIFYKIG